MNRRGKSPRRRFPFLVSLKTASRRRGASDEGRRDERYRSNRQIYQAMVSSGVRWVLLLAFVILLLVAVEEISVVVFGREPHQTFTPTLISALTAIIGGILLFFRQIIRYYRDNHPRDQEQEDELRE